MPSYINSTPSSRRLPFLTTCACTLLASHFSAFSQTAPPIVINQYERAQPTSATRLREHHPKLENSNASQQESNVVEAKAKAITKEEDAASAESEVTNSVEASQDKVARPDRLPKNETEQSGASSDAETDNKDRPQSTVEATSAAPKKKKKKKRKSSAQKSASILKDLRAPVKFRVQAEVETPAEKPREKAAPSFKRSGPRSRFR